MKYMAKRVCKVCGKEFITKGHSQTCSEGCGWELRYRRQVLGWDKLLRGIGVR